MKKKAVTHIRQVGKGIMVTGFSVQIVLGIIWMCSNFAYVQDFGAPESAFYGAIYSLLGECPQVMYVLQLAAGFGASYLLLQELCPVSKWFAVWRGLAVVTFPFALQTALAVQPQSLVGSLFILLLWFCIKRTGKWWLRMAGVLLCGMLVFGLSGIADRADGARVWDYGWEASLAGRAAWFTLINDRQDWPEEVQQYTEGAWWEATFCADNMVHLLEAIEEQAGEELAGEYYLQIAEIAWEKRKTVIVRQVAWDLLGYVVSPLVVPMQLKGEAYDSYTAGNYAVMREHTPKLTGYYVAYGCWWFGWAFALTVLLSLTEAVMFIQGRQATVGPLVGRRGIYVAAACVCASGMVVFLLTMRSAGVMDYRWTTAVNQLWLVWGLVTVRRDGSRSFAMKEGR